MATLEAFLEFFYMETNRVSQCILYWKITTPSIRQVLWGKTWTRGKPVELVLTNKPIKFFSGILI